MDGSEVVVRKSIADDGSEPSLFPVSGWMSTKLFSYNISSNVAVDPNYSS